MDFTFAFLEVEVEPQEEKDNICRNEGNILAESDWRESGHLQSFSRIEWVQRGSDGDCMCSDGGQPQLCQRPGDGPQGEDRCRQMGAMQVPGVTVGAVTCQCSETDTRTFAVNASNPCSTPVSVVEPPPTQPTVALRECVDGWKAQSASCTQASGLARTACARVRENSARTNQTNNTLENASELYSQLKTGAGAQDKCFIASMASHQGRQAVGRLQGNCNDEHEACISGCQNKLQEFESQCSRLISAGNATSNAVTQTQLNQNYYNENRSEIAANFTSGSEVCSGEVAQNRSVFSGILEGLGQALTTSTRCMCQLSSSRSNCDSIPSVDACQTNPNTSGCAIYSGIGVCSPGLSYNATECNCQLNPTTPGCAGRVDPKNNLSGFASNIAKSAAASDAGVSAFAAGPSGNGSGAGSAGLDFSSGSPASSVDAAALGAVGDGGGLGEGLPAAGGTGGGGSFAGGGFGSPLGEDAAVEGGETSKGGMMSQLKTIASRLMKGKDNANGQLQDQKNLKNQGSSPRGLASARKGVGSKNMNIWQMMNQCVQGETCKTNQSGYIQAP